MRRPGSGDGVFCLRRRGGTMTPKLDIGDLTKRFPRGDGWLDVLDRVSLHVAPREFVTLLGPSGCGKSTLCNIVAGLIPQDAGRVLLDGAPLGPRRGRVAYMQQKDLLLPWRRVIDNAILGLEVQGVPRAEARDEARDLLRRFGLERFEWYYPALLSCGRLGSGNPRRAPIRQRLLGPGGSSRCGARWPGPARRRSCWRRSSRRGSGGCARLGSRSTSCPRPTGSRA